MLIDLLQPVSAYIREVFVVKLQRCVLLGHMA